MSHSEIIISRKIVQADNQPTVEATVVYRPPDSAGPKEIGKMVARISRRMDALADEYSDE